MRKAKIKEAKKKEAKRKEANMCEKHQQIQQLFCKDDQKPICVVCSLAREHRFHTVIPIEEAVEEHKEPLEIFHRHLKDGLTNRKTIKTEVQKKQAELEREFQGLNERVTSTFYELQQFLEKKWKMILRKLKEEQEENRKKIQEKMADLEKQSSSLVDLITEIAEQQGKQDVEFMKDITSLVNRSVQVEVLKPEDEFAVMESSLHSSSIQRAYVRDTMEELKETFAAELEKIYRKNFNMVPTLDPNTARSMNIYSEPPSSSDLEENPLLNLMRTMSFVKLSPFGSCHPPKS